jgi:hypothetical protein
MAEWGGGVSGEELGFPRLRCLSVRIWAFICSRLVMGSAQ